MGIIGLFVWVGGKVSIFLFVLWIGVDGLEPSNTYFLENEYDSQQLILNLGAKEGFRKARTQNAAMSMCRTSKELWLWRFRWRNATSIKRKMSDKP